METQPESPEVVIARARARLAEREGAPPVPDEETQQRLPTSSTVPLVTMTMDQLHDLVYGATSNYLHSLSKMTREKAQLHASRVSIEAQKMATRYGHVHQGEAP